MISQMTSRTKWILSLSLLSIGIVFAVLYVLNGKFHFFADVQTTSLDWAVLPRNSSTQPLVSEWLGVQITNPTANARYYKISVSGASGVPDQWIEKSGQQIHVPANIVSPRSGTLDLTVTAYDEMNGRPLREYDDRLQVYYDYTFQNLEDSFNIVAESLENGDIKLRASLKDASLSALRDKVEYYRWAVMNFADKNYPAYYTEEPEITLPMNQPGLTYINLKVQNRAAYDVKGYYYPHSVSAAKIAIKINKEDDTPPPEIPAHLTDDYPNVFSSSVKIPGDMKLPLYADKVTMFSGGSLSIPVNLREFKATIDPDYIEIDLPEGVALNQLNYYAVSTDFAEVPGAPTSYKRYRITKKAGKTWGRVTTIYPTFADNLAGRVNLKMRLRAVNASQLQREDNWQEQALILASTPDFRPMERITASFSWARARSLFLNSGETTNIDDFLNLYKKFGFNTVPNNLINSQPASSSLFYTPEQRSTTHWEDLRYGPESNLFLQNSVTQGFAKLKLSSYSDIPKGSDGIVSQEEFDAYANATDFNQKFNVSLNEPQLSNERTKWKNAIHYNMDNGEIDMGYDGILLQNDLDEINAQMKVSKPEYLFLDCEEFPSYSRWKTTVMSSQNAQSRLRTGESQDDLADRIVEEFVSRMTVAIRADSPSTKITMYDFWATNTRDSFSNIALADTDSTEGVNIMPTAIPNRQNQLFGAPLLKKYNIIPAPCLYYQGVNLDEYGASLRANRLAMSRDQELIPWLTLGTYAFKKSTDMFDEVTHALLNGATGFSLYTDKDIDDMGHILEISKAIKLLAPFEDLIMDGDLAFWDIRGKSNVTVSAMKKDGSYLIAATPKDQAVTSTFTIETMDNKRYELKNENSGESELVSGPEVLISQPLTSTTVFSLKIISETDEPIPPIISSVNISEGQVITTNPYLITAKIENPMTISKVEFYVDDVLIGTSTLPDISGAFEASWDTSKYHSLVKIIAYDANGSTAEISRSATVRLPEVDDVGPNPPSGVSETHDDVDVPNQNASVAAPTYAPSQIVVSLPKTGQERGVIKNESCRARFLPIFCKLLISRFF